MIDIAVIKNNKLLFIVLLLIALNVRNLSSYYYCLLPLSCGLSSINLKSNKTVILSVLLIMSVLLCMDLYYITWTIKMLLIAVLSKCVLKKRDSYKKVETIILFLSFGFALQLILNYWYNLSIGLYSGRTFYSLSTMEISSATGMAMLLIPFAGIVPAYILFMNSGKIKSTIVFLLYLIFSLLANLWLEGRTYFVVLGITFIVALLFVFNVKKQLYEQVLLKKNISTFLVISFLVTIFFSQKIISVYESSNFYNRFNSGYENITETPRTERVSFYLEHFFDSPFGGGNIKNQIYGQRSHIAYLDCLDSCGIFTFIIFVMIMWFCNKTIYKSITNRHEEIPLRSKVLLLGVLVAVNLSFLVEPVVDGAQWIIEYYWFISCLLYYYQNKVSEFYVLTVNQM